MVVVAPAEPQHVEALAALLAEMERFYGATQVEPLDQRIVPTLTFIPIPGWP